MDSLQWSLDVGHAVAKYAPRCLAATMPALQDAAFVASLAWHVNSLRPYPNLPLIPLSVRILYRIWQIYQKPVDELVNLLGLDIPPLPEVSLAGITTDGVLLYWKPPDNPHPSLTHAIHVNGIKVGEFGRGDTSIQVTGLKPGHFYNIRVIASNAANFSTLGPLMRLRTLPATSMTVDGAPAESNEGLITEPNHNEAATIHTSSAHIEPAVAQQMIRENSGGVGQSKRPISGRRSVPATSGNEHFPSYAAVEGDEERFTGDERLETLTKKLDSLRQEQQELDRQILEEEEETKRATADLARERDRLKQTLKEKEEGNAELKRQGNLLNKQQKTAQSRKAQKERLLNAKKAERQKMKDETSRWDREVTDIRRELEEITREKAEAIANKDRDILNIRTSIAEDQTVIKSLEEDIRATGSQIKALEKDREKLSDGGDEEQSLAAREKQEDQAWEVHAQGIQLHLTGLWQTLQQVNAESQRARDHLAYWTNRHARDPAEFVPLSALDYTSLRSNRPRRSRHNNPRTSAMTSPQESYAIGSGPYSISRVSPPFSSVSPFFSMGNGMAVPLQSEPSSIPQGDMEALTGGAQMSPAADDLLPSNLFRDDDLMARRTSTAAIGESLGSWGSDVFGRQTDTTAQRPHTPVSVSSRNGSRFSSPHDSIHNPPAYATNGETSTEPDRRSIQSTNASFHPPLVTDANPLGANKIATLFSQTFNRQRGKSGSNDPPQLGTLRQGQSQSFPRNLEDEDLDLSGARRRRGSHGHWANPMGLLNRTGAEDSGLIRVRTGSGRRSRLNMFGSNSNSLQPSAFGDNSSSTRPSSINSFDQVLGRPSSESQRNPWAIPESAPNRGSPLGTTWAISGPWSRGPSRRPSVQHGSTSNLSIGSTPLEPDYPGGVTKQISDQLPIGTRPRGGSGQSLQRPVTPKLNPTAPSFKTLFSRGEAKKTAKLDRALEKAKEKPTDFEESDPPHEESSPQNPRTSRDAPSIVTSASISESHDSLDRSTSGTQSETVTPSGPKETFMQRISRKGSSSKFNVPWSKDRGGLFSRKTGDSTPSGPPSGEFDEDAGSEKYDDSITSTPHPAEKSSRTSLSWPNIRRKSKKNGLAAVDPAEKNTCDAGEDQEP